MAPTHSADWRKNIKQVIRIALVGLSASDQVLIKGYMRVLMRVDYDLEWVMPKHPQVDLLIVHNKFSNAEAIQTLLANSEKLAALFIEHNDKKSNVIENDVLYLSLEHLAPLKEWLSENLAVIRAVDAKSNDEYSDEVDLNALNENASNVDGILLDDQHTGQFASQAAKITEPEPGNLSVSEQTVVLYNNLHNRSDQEFYFDIYNDDKVIATVHPKSRRVWPRGDTFYPAFSFGWSSNDLSRAQFNTLELSIERAMNLHNWLWRCAHKPSSTVEHAIPDNTRISLKFWPKPAGDSDKSAFLRMLALTEAKPVNAQEIISTLKVSELLARRFLGALYVCGMANTQALPSSDALLKMQMSTRQSDGATQGINSELVKAYQQEQKVQEKVTAAAQEEKRPKIAQDEKLGGILGKIRSVLGL